jgi:hypothetical protein
MIESWRKGKSVDNGFYKRKDLKIIHYEHLPLEDGVFAEAVSSNGKTRLMNRRFSELTWKGFWSQAYGQGVGTVRA